MKRVRIQTLLSLTIKTSLVLLREQTTIVQMSRRLFRNTRTRGSQLELVLVKQSLLLEAKLVSSDKWWVYVIFSCFIMLLFYFIL